ncbi:MAG: urease subunit beta [Helicobacteraceae bacterium]|jgi:urease subunit gamma/beta|nr:urease subunit beta [Helicobacteraceae bacterium]
MFLTKREQERTLIFSAAQMALARKNRGIKLNCPEAVAIISSSIIEGARDGKSVAELMSAATKILREEDLIDGTAQMIDIVQVEAVFDDGTKLVSVHNPIACNRAATVGEYIIDEGEIELNKDADEIILEVNNGGDRPIQIGSHFHFFETNKALKFDREKAYGRRLNIPAGTSVRFEPGSVKEIALIPFGGKRFISGFNGLVEGFLDDESTRKEAFNRLRVFLGE